MIVLASPSLQPEFNPKIPQDGRRSYPLAHPCFLSPTGLGERHLDFKTIQFLSFQLTTDQYPVNSGRHTHSWVCVLDK